MLLTTERLLIKEITTADAAFYFKLLNSPGFIQHIGNRNIHSVEVAKNYIIKNVLSSYKLNGYGFYKLMKRDTEEVLGVCGFVKRTFLDEPDFGYAILPEFEGKGYTKEAAKVILPYGCEKWGLNTVLGITRPANTPSIKLLESLQFHQIGATEDPLNNESLILFSYKHSKK